MSEEKTETDDEFDARYVAYFNRKDIDGWEIRKAYQGSDYSAAVTPATKISVVNLSYSDEMDSNDITDGSWPGLALLVQTKNLRPSVRVLDHGV